MIRTTLAAVALLCSSAAYSQQPTDGGMNAELLIAIQSLSAKIDRLTEATTASRIGPPIISAPAPVQVASPVVMPSDVCGTEQQFVAIDTGLSRADLIRYLGTQTTISRPVIRDVTDESSFRIRFVDRLFRRQSTFELGPYLIETEPRWFSTRVSIR